MKKKVLIGSIAVVLAAAMLFWGIYENNKKKPEPPPVKPNHPEWTALEAKFRYFDFTVEDLKKGVEILFKDSKFSLGKMKVEKGEGKGDNQYFFEVKVEGRQEKIWLQLRQLEYYYNTIFIHFDQVKGKKDETIKDLFYQLLPLLDPDMFEKKTEKTAQEVVDYFKLDDTQEQIINNKGNIKINTRLYMLQKTYYYPNIYGKRTFEINFDRWVKKLS